ncbi:hypothetical protein DUNSADRAFT_11562 [Dunaliella salina]|uniref:Encoded protein n=1 Tax=Dunaliella salina TaxID=3046 RepID=A0ABQ7GD54_DUNSA|nr:hypothetical protein DUNSADRAFT_11562 [Dunaliella salina]|eukprot:KAF5832525.1 hypothetical protein DUNSADRAFT_11562 [Dunaliella salina]
MEQQRETAEARRRRHRVSGGGAAGEAEPQGGGGSGGNGVGDGGGTPSLRRRRRRSSGRRRSEGGHGTPDGRQQGGGGREMGSLMQQVRQARASLMRAVDLVVAMHLLIEYMFLQGAVTFLHNFTFGASYRSPAGTAPSPAAPAAAAAPEPRVYEMGDSNNDGGRQDMPSGSRTAIPSCSSIAHHGHSFAIAAAGASAAEVESGPMDDGEISSPMWTMEASPPP